MQRVFEKAHARLGPALDEPGSVPPQVLKCVLDEAQFADDELRAEYLGGVLASSRSPIGRDDRAASMAHLVASLSTYALRAHYVFYATVQRSNTGRGADAWRASHDGDRRMYMTLDDFVQAMAFDEQELRNFAGIIADTMLSLERNGLVSSWLRGSPAFLAENIVEHAFPADGIVFNPTQHGILLFCAGHGVRTDPYEAFAGQRLELCVNIPPTIPVGVLVSNLPQRRSADDSR
ncbi:MAG: hypothetical protein ACRDJX_03465 [Solirubrobacteraceae bacterium]